MLLHFRGLRACFISIDNLLQGRKKPTGSFKLELWQATSKRLFSMHVYNNCCGRFTITLSYWSESSSQSKSKSCFLITFSALSSFLCYLLHFHRQQWHNLNPATTVREWHQGISWKSEHLDQVLFTLTSFCFHFDFQGNFADRNVLPTAVNLVTPPIAWRSGQTLMDAPLANTVLLLKRTFLSMNK